jgi:cellulose synthase/poly-beta-1,6-N-acetylglucosamine synthase-like glycosyltransferase
MYEPVENLTTVHLVLGGSLALVLYSYVGYPILLWLTGLLRRHESSHLRDPSAWPDVSIVISAYNEQSVLGRRIENLLDLDYPSSRLRILIGSDGSTDSTARTVPHHPRIALYDFPKRRGKAEVLNDLVSRATGEYVVFTDANTQFAADAVKELMRGFHAVPSASAVVGQVKFRTAEGAVNPDHRYWRYESALKAMESRYGAVIGANGAIYAIRREWFRPLPPGTIIDDFLIPMLIRLQRGGPVIYRPTAKAFETVPERVRDEFRRRVRIGAGDAHALRETWRLLLPDHGMLAVSYWSHKVFRWMGPWLLIVAFLSNLWISNRAWAQALLGAQLAVYAMALTAPLFRRVPWIGSGATAARYFIVLNAALLLGTLKFMTGRSAPVWQTTPRTTDTLSLLPPQGRPERLPASRQDKPAA